jgi:hypothetical protein
MNAIYSRFSTVGAVVICFLSSVGTLNYMISDLKRIQLKDENQRMEYETKNEGINEKVKTRNLPH